MKTDNKAMKSYYFPHNGMWTSGIPKKFPTILVDNILLYLFLDMLIWMYMKFGVKI